MLTDSEIMAMVLAAFQEEQAEHCQAIGDILLDLERDPQTPKRKEVLDQLFREAHSLKGGARAAGIEPVELLAHRIEDVFSAVRSGALVLTPDVCDPIYASLDAIRDIMSQVSANQPVLIEPYQGLLNTLGQILESEQQTNNAAPAPASSNPPSLPNIPSFPIPSPDDEPYPVDVSPPMREKEVDEEPIDDLRIIAMAESPVAVDETSIVMDESPAAANEMPIAADGSSTEMVMSSPAPPRPTPASESSDDAHWETVSTTVRLSTSSLDSLLNETGELITCSVRASQRLADAQHIADPMLRWRRLWRQARPVITMIQENIPEFQPTVHHLDRHDETSSANHKRDQSHEQHHIPLHAIATMLETLMQANTILGELEKNMSAHVRKMTEDYSRLAAVIDRLHDQVRRTRMLPLTTLLSPLRLQMREMARSAKKDVVLMLDDGGAEADRQVLERLREVLLHLLRNAVDHGIESTERRIANGKPPQGTIALRASVSGDYLAIVVEDDGTGLDIRVIRERAREHGLMSDTELTRVQDDDLIDLIFAPGFSTRQTVSTLSGRGVGLDIVRSQVERMHGRVAVQSTPGVGCAFTISVPLSLTSSHGLLLRVSDATYMLPLESVQRIVSVTPNDIQIVEGRAAYILDGRPIALMHLADLLGEVTSIVQRQAPDTHRAQHSFLAVGQNAGGRSLALLLGSGERQVACMVDAVLGEQELVVHRLPAPINRLRFIAGATILADGSVVPILDLVDVIRAAIGSRRMVNMQAKVAEAQRRPTVLVVDDSITTRTLEKNILEAAGYHVHLATDGAEALNVLDTLANNGGCDLLLSDVDMPRLNGFDLTTQVRTHRTFQHLPIVLVTSLDKPADRERGIAAGADAYIIKRSFDQQTLLDTIAQLI